MNGSRTPDGLWLPGVRKAEGGSRFDDELETADQVLKNETMKLVANLNERPDHIVYVSSVDERDKMRDILNWFRREKWIDHNPAIKIEYGLPDGAIRTGE